MARHPDQHKRRRNSDTERWRLGTEPQPGPPCHRLRPLDRERRRGQPRQVPQPDQRGRRALPVPGRQDLVLPVQRVLLSGEPPCLISPFSHLCTHEEITRIPQARRRTAGVIRTPQFHQWRR